jgi:hypothetical protein
LSNYNNNSAPAVNPVDQATAEQIRYETQKQREEDQALKKQQAQDDANEERIDAIEMKKRQIAALKAGVDQEDLGIIDDNSEIVA